MEVTLAGEPGRQWLRGVIFETCGQAIDGVRAKLDHHFLNDVAGLGTPSLENLARWIAEQLHPAIAAASPASAVRRPSLGESCRFDLTWSERCIVLHSGGLDSTVCLLTPLAKAKGRTPRSLGISYGQRHSVEMDYAAKLCARFGIERRVIDVNWDTPQITIPKDRSVEEMKAGIAPTFVPGRNAVFFGAGLRAEAAGFGATEVWARRQRRRLFRLSRLP